MNNNLNTDSTDSGHGCLDQIQVRALLHSGIYRSYRESYWAPTNYDCTTAGLQMARAFCSSLTLGLSGSFGSIGGGRGADVYLSSVVGEEEYLWRLDENGDLTPVDEDGDEIDGNHAIDPPSIIDEELTSSEARQLFLAAVDVEWDGNNFVSCMPRGEYGDYTGPVGECDYDEYSTLLISDDGCLYLGAQPGYSEVASNYEPSIWDSAQDASNADCPVNVFVSELPCASKDDPVWICVVADEDVDEFDAWLECAGDDETR